MSGNTIGTSTQEGGTEVTLAGEALNMSGITPLEPPVIRPRSSTPADRPTTMEGMAKLVDLQVNV